jgi:hypothetical protein
LTSDAKFSRIGELQNTEEQTRLQMVNIKSLSAVIAKPVCVPIVWERWLALAGENEIFERKAQPRSQGTIKAFQIWALVNGDVGTGDFKSHWAPTRES